MIPVQAPTDADQGRYIRYAAPAPVDSDEVDSPRNCEQDRTAHELCEDWALWCHTRRFLGAPRPLHINSIARWAAPMRATAHVGRDGAMDADLQRLNTAIIAQPMSKARQAFILYYLNRVRPVKKIADALGVSRKHVYDLIASFRQDALHANRALSTSKVSPPEVTKKQVTESA